jgi:hypothetical protein
LRPGGKAAEQAARLENDDELANLPLPPEQRVALMVAEIPAAFAWELAPHHDAETIIRRYTDGIPTSSVDTFTAMELSDAQMAKVRGVAPAFVQVAHQDLGHTIDKTRELWDLGFRSEDDLRPFEGMCILASEMDALRGLPNSDDAIALKRELNLSVEDIRYVLSHVTLTYAREAIGELKFSANQAVALSQTRRTLPEARELTALGWSTDAVVRTGALKLSVNELERFGRLFKLAPLIHAVNSGMPIDFAEHFEQMGPQGTQTLWDETVLPRDKAKALYDRGYREVARMEWVHLSQLPLPLILGVEIPTVEKDPDGMDTSSRITCLANDYAAARDIKIKK